MDIVTWGMVLVLIIIFGVRYLFEYRMFKNSVYRILYRNFTEYHMRKKSIERMSESYVLKAEFGGGRMIYQVIDPKSYNPSSFVTIFLQSGCYVFGIANIAKSEKATLKICKDFYQENIKNKMMDSIYATKNIPTSFYVVVPDNSSYKENVHVIKRQSIMAVLQKGKEQNGVILSNDDLEHLFRIVAKEALSDEHENRFFTILTTDR